ncbi:Acyl-CoA--sterol O-acyltransferase 1 (Sterol O-acyltransferase 1) [Durusdinium trenchii]
MGVMEMQLLDIALCIPVRFIFGYVTFQIYRLTKRREGKLQDKSLLPYLYLEELRPLLAMAIGAAWAAHPFILAMCLGPLRSLLGHFVLSYSGVISTFRWLELVAGLGPKGFDATAWTFATYMGIPVEVQFEDGKLKRINKKRWRIVLDFAWRLAIHAVIMLAALSFGKATDYKPFLDEPPAALPRFGLPWSIPVTMRAPLSQSTSIRDFWGRRWNLIIHGLMKRCFFMPFQNAGPMRKNLAGLLSFAMSGLFHEYMWLTLHVARPESSRYVAGKVLSFFLVQYLSTAFEVLLGKTRLGQLAAPAVLRTVLTTLCILPFGPLFLEGIYEMTHESVNLLPAIGFL